MALSGVIKYPDGRTIYGSHTTPYAPTNPKAGPTVGGNTLVWNPANRESTLIFPRQGGANVANWEAESRTTPRVPGTASNRTTYQNPNADKYGRTGVKIAQYSTRAITTGKLVTSRYSANSGLTSCPPAPPGLSLCTGTTYGTYQKK